MGNIRGRRPGVLRAQGHRAQGHRQEGGRDQGGSGSYRSTGPTGGCPWLAGGPGCAWCSKTWRGRHGLPSPSPGGWSSAHGHGLSPRERELASGGTLRTEPSSAGRAASEEPLSSVHGDNSPPPPHPGILGLGGGHIGRAYRQAHSPQRLLSECVSRRQSGCVFTSRSPPSTSTGACRCPRPIPEDTSRWSKCRASSLTAWVQILAPLPTNTPLATAAYCTASFCVRRNSSLSRTRRCV